MKSNDENQWKRLKAKEGNYRWLPDPKPNPEELIVQEVSKVLCKMRARHGVSLVQCIGALTCIINHLSAYLLEEGFSEADNS